MANKQRQAGPSLPVHVVEFMAGATLALAADVGVNIGDTGSPTATPTVYNVTLALADTEYNQVMPASCRRFEFQCRTSAAVQFAFVTGKVAAPTAPYMTLKSADAYDSGPINQEASPSTLYLASATAGVVVEIIAWT